MNNEHLRWFVWKTEDDGGGICRGGSCNKILIYLIQQSIALCPRRLVLEMSVTQHNERDTKQD